MSKLDEPEVAAALARAKAIKMIHDTNEIMMLRHGPRYRFDSNAPYISSFVEVIATELLAVESRVRGMKRELDRYFEYVGWYPEGS